MAAHRSAMEHGHTVDLELRVTGLADCIRIRVGHFGDRSAASVEIGRITSSGIGVSAREALVAALAPLGQRMTSTVMAAPAMFGASADLLAVAD